MLLSGVLFLLGALHTTAALQAKCTLHLHNSKQNVGQVLFSSEGKTSQKIEINVEGPADIFTEGYRTLNIHKGKIKKQDCNTAGPHFEPTNSKLREENLGSLRFGERGEANLRHTITIDPNAPVGVSGLIEGVMHCPNEHVALWSDGREDLITDLPKALKMKQNLDRKGGKTFMIVEREVDCYVPVWNAEEWSLQTARFEVAGRGGIVGRSVVVQRGEDGDDPVACCTLKLGVGEE